MLTFIVFMPTITPLQPKCPRPSTIVFVNFSLSLPSPFTSICNAKYFQLCNKMPRICYYSIISTFLFLFLYILWISEVIEFVLSAPELYDIYSYSSDCVFIQRSHSHQQWEFVFNHKHFCNACFMIYVIYILYIYHIYVFFIYAILIKVWRPCHFSIFLKTREDEDIYICCWPPTCLLSEIVYYGARAVAQR